ncbi:hypothetical protein [Roseburia sp. 499]|uniref:hypothetical protein n=1 Tax=Roseburia sp. 499 TaxID=1261634 RepID=UPI0009536654|nr:hypothetical protein [Roseburia sp. 499]WVK70864.1 hypothetical protein BIV20_04840 [Roseburia sp. 499]
MKKRIFALATALVMTLSMGMTAFAAESPTVTNSNLAGKFAESATAVIDGQTVELKFDYGLRPKNLTQAQIDSVNYYMPMERTSNDEEWQRLQEKQDERTRELFEKVMGYRNESVDMNDWFGLSLPEGYTMPAEGVEVTIDAPYAGKGDYTYYIFHCKADGTWEYIPTTEGDGTLSGRFTSFSPVFILRIPKENTTSTPSTDTAKQTVQTPATTTQNATSTTKAPKTGEFAGIYVAGMTAVLSAAGIVAYVRKKNVRL